MNRLYCLLIIFTLISCSKSVKEDLHVVCPAPGNEPAWLLAKQAEYSSCTCKTTFSRGIYNNEYVIVIAGIDPLCNGITIVYKADGTQLMTSANEAAYKLFNAQVKDLTIIWTCTNSIKS